jgi:hypothetical protein
MAVPLPWQSSIAVAMRFSSAVWLVLGKRQVKPGACNSATSVGWGCPHHNPAGPHLPTRGRTHCHQQPQTGKVFLSTRSDHNGSNRQALDPQEPPMFKSTYPSKNNNNDDKWGGYGGNHDKNDKWNDDYSKNDKWDNDKYGCHDSKTDHYDNNKWDDDYKNDKYDDDSKYGCNDKYDNNKWDDDKYGCHDNSYNHYNS